MRKISEVFINGVCLDEILEKHRKWLNGEDGGERADLKFTNLSCTELSDIDLSCADLRCVSLKDSCLRDTVLSASAVKTYVDAAVSAIDHRVYYGGDDAE
jgi:uncharacterized protein YjbI with pentapeptide repeats